MVEKRTTVSADADDLAVLEYEAKRRGVSLSNVLREAVAEYVMTIRKTRKPRFGVASGGSGLSQMSADDEAMPVLAQAGDHEA